MVSCSLVDLVNWIVVACRACVWRKAGGAVVGVSRCNVGDLRFAGTRGPAVFQKF